MLQQTPSANLANMLRPTGNAELNAFSALIVATIIKKGIEAGPNKYGLYETKRTDPDTGKTTYLDATVVRLNEFGYVSSVGEEISEEQMKERRAARRELLHNPGGKKDGQAILLPVTTTQLYPGGENNYSGLLIYNPKTQAYEAPGQAAPSPEQPEDFDTEADLGLTAVLRGSQLGPYRTIGAIDGSWEMKLGRHLTVHGEKMYGPDFNHLLTDAKKVKPIPESTKNDIFNSPN